MSDDPVWKKIDKHEQRLSDHEIEIRMLSNRFERLENTVAANQKDLIHELNAFRAEVTPLCKKVESMEKETLIEKGRQEERVRVEREKEIEQSEKDNSLKRYHTVIGIAVGVLTILTILGYLGTT